MLLSQCACCRRHVKSTDAHCPFCGARNAAARMQHTGLFLALAVGAGAIVACSSSDSEPGAAGAAGTYSPGTGGASGGSAGFDANADVSNDDGSYGGYGGYGGNGGYGGTYSPPPPWDGGPVTTDASDAGPADASADTIDASAPPDDVSQDGMSAD